MSIVSTARLGRLRLTDAHTQQVLATFDYRIRRGSTREAEAETYRDTLAFAWACTPALLCDATIFGFHLEEAVHCDDGREPEYIPVTFREPLSGIQLVQTLLRYLQKLGRVTTPRPTAREYSASHIERVRSDLMAARAV
jgi:hypothetical protein